MNKWADFIIIDDDPLNNQIIHITLKKYAGNLNSVTFTNVPDSLNFIAGIKTDTGSEKGIILLDINMPEMNGWEFLDQFSTLNPEITKHYKVYILTSSIDNNDLKRAQSNKQVSGYLIKPITKENIFSLIEKRIK